jgi:hypothetical protein
MSRLRLRPRGFIPDIAFGREPSNSTGGTFTRVDASFSSARLNSEIKKHRSAGRGLVEESCNKTAASLLAQNDVDKLTPCF